MSTPTRISRRGALGLGVGAGVVALTGCTLNNPYSGSDSATEAKALAPDVRLAVEVVAAQQGLIEIVTRTRARYPALSSRFAAITTMHRAHLTALSDTVPAGVHPGVSQSAYVVPARVPKALTAVEASEQTLHNQLTGFALRAESGEFARLLGAMAASVSQHLIGL